MTSGPGEENPIPFRYELRLADGDDAGTIETRGQPGDTVIAHGNRWYRITAVIPGERISEFVDAREVDGVLEVEAL